MRIFYSSNRVCQYWSDTVILVFNVALIYKYNLANSIHLSILVDNDYGVGRCSRQEMMYSMGWGGTHMLAQLQCSIQGRATVCPYIYALHSYYISQSIYIDILLYYCIQSILSPLIFDNVGPAQSSIQGVVSIGSRVYLSAYTNIRLDIAYSSLCMHSTGSQSKAVTIGVQACLDCLLTSYGYSTRCVTSY